MAMDIVHEPPYMAMDYVQGIDLHQQLKSHGWTPLDETLRIARDVGAALAVAHAEGFIHRDIKPSNIMLAQTSTTEAIRVILMEFGIIKLQDANTLTGTGAIGTIDYMAPEQIVSARQVDFRADIYAMGAMVYEMLSGKPPFRGGAAQVMFAHIQQPPPDIRDEDDAIPRHVALALLKALAKEPDERFDGVLSFVQTLEKRAD